MGEFATAVTYIKNNRDTNELFEGKVVELFPRWRINRDDEEILEWVITVEGLGTFTGSDPTDLLGQITIGDNVATRVGEV